MGFLKSAEEMGYSGTFEDFFYKPGMYVGTAGLLSGLVVLPLSYYCRDIDLADKGVKLFLSGLSNIILYSAARPVFSLISKSNLEGISKDSNNHSS